MLTPSYIVTLLDTKEATPPSGRFRSAFVTPELPSQALALIEPEIKAIMTKDSVAGLSIVVLDPTQPYENRGGSTLTPYDELEAFAETVLFHDNLGDSTTWEKSDRYAFGKAKVVWVFGMDSDKVERTRNRQGDCSSPGGIIFRGIIIAVSGHPNGEIDKKIAYMLATAIDDLVYKDYTSREQPAFFE